MQLYTYAGFLLLLLRVITLLTKWLVLNLNVVINNEYGEKIVWTWAEIHSSACAAQQKARTITYGVHAYLEQNIHSVLVLVRIYQTFDASQILSKIRNKNLDPGIRPDIKPLEKSSVVQR